MTEVAWLHARMAEIKERLTLMTPSSTPQATPRATEHPAAATATAIVATAAAAAAAASAAAAADAQELEPPSPPMTPRTSLLAARAEELRERLRMARIAAELQVGPGGYCLPRHRVPFYSRARVQSASDVAGSFRQARAAGSHADGG